MSTDIMAAFDAATASYHAALHRLRELGAEMMAARAVAHEAAILADRLLSAAALSNDVGHQQILDARAEVNRLNVMEEILEGKVRHASKLVRETEAKMLTAKAAVLQHEREVEVEKLYDSAAKVDNSLAQVQSDLAAYIAQGRAVRAANERAHTFNMEVRSAIERSDVLQHMKFIGTLPHTAAPQYFGVPEPRAELCMDVDAGKISARRVSIPALAVLIREATR